MKSGGKTAALHNLQMDRYMLWCFLLTAEGGWARIRANKPSVLGGFGSRTRPFIDWRHEGESAAEGKRMQFLPGFTVQCINPGCEARGQWLRADATRAFSVEGRCPCCGDSLRNVPPPLGPRFRMRPRALTARPPLRPRPR